MKIKTNNKAVKAAYGMEKARALHEKRKARGEAIISDLKSESLDVQKKLDILFDEYVPSSGKSKCLAGELARAMSRIVARGYNDGDRFYEGYGLETCGEAAQFIYNHVPDSQQIFYDISDRQLSSLDQYLECLDDVTSAVIQWIIDNPRSLTQPTEDMFDTELDEIADMESNDYEYDVDTSGDLEEYIDNDCISWEDVRSFLDELTYSYGGSVDQWARDAFTVRDLNREEYDEWENRFFSELDSWLEELEREYPNFGRDDEDEDEEEY